MAAAPRTLPSPSELPEFLDQRGVVEVVVCGLTALAYVSTLSFGFVYDDQVVIVDNPVIRSWRLLAQSLSPHISPAMAPPASGTFYRPFTLLWLRLNYALFGLHPAGWHFAMLACHVLMTWLVFLVVESLSRKRSLAAIAALLFGLHPVHVENVAWLSSVNDLLMSVLLLAGFLAYLSFRDGDGRKVWMSKKIAMALSLLCFLLALLSKETAAAFPVVILCFAVIFPPPTGRTPGPDLKPAWVSLPYFILLAAFIIFRSLRMHALLQPIATLTWRTMALTWPSVLWFDLKHLLFPISSSEFYSLTYVSSPAVDNFLLPVLCLLIFVLAAGYWISRLPGRPLALFAAALALLTTLPTLYLRAIAPENFVHDRFLYLPSVGIVILLALALDRIPAAKTLVAGISAKWTVVSILCAAAFAGTVSHQLQWASNILLYGNGLKYAPLNLVVQDNLANEFANLGRFDRAVPLYLDALQRDPRFWPANYNLGCAYYRIGRFPEAEAYLQRAVEIDDSDPDQFIYLARAQMAQGKLPQAARSAESAIRISPQSPGFHLVLGKILEALAQRQQAIAEYQAEALSHPENPAAKSELQRLQSSPQ